MGWKYRDIPLLDGGHVFDSLVRQPRPKLCVGTLCLFWRNSCLFCATVKPHLKLGLGKNRLWIFPNMKIIICYIFKNVPKISQDLARFLVVVHEVEVMDGKVTLIRDLGNVIHINWSIFFFADKSSYYYPSNRDVLIRIKVIEYNFVDAIGSR